MVVAKHTSTSQLCLSKAGVEQADPADDSDVVCANERIVLTLIRPGGAAAVRTRLAELGISQADVVEAVLVTHGCSAIRFRVLVDSSVPAPA